MKHNNKDLVSAWVALEECIKTKCSQGNFGALRSGWPPHCLVFISYPAIIDLRFNKKDRREREREREREGVTRKGMIVMNNACLCMC